MSYSRWINSYWYTYYHAREDEDATVDKQLFCIDCEWYFTYKELKKDIKNCINIVKKGIKTNKNIIKKATKEDYKELKKYMKAFMYDAEHQNEW